MNRAAMTSRFLAFALLTSALSLAGCSSEPQQSQAGAAPLAGAAIGGPFALVDKDGKTVRWQDFAGRYRIVYFGYTFCPDACPLDLGKMMQGFALFAKAQPALADKIQPMFITIDPARDTPKIMGEYTASFSPRLLGLTGSQAAIDQAAKAFRVYYAKGDKTPGGGYLMNHSRVALLMGPQGEPISMLPVDQDPPAVAAELAKWVK
jgi:protein SCO1/2